MSKNTFNAIQAVFKDSGWMIFTELMHDKIETLADRSAQIVANMYCPQTKLSCAIQFKGSSYVPPIADKHKQTAPILEGSNQP